LNRLGAVGRRLAAVLSIVPRRKVACWAQGPHRLTRLQSKRCKSIGIELERLAFFRERHLLAVAAEKPDAEVILQQLDTRRHVRRHASDGLRSLGYTAIARDRQKYFNR
jgi:hypothetical protein